MGDMVKFPIAVNCTMPEGKFLASAEAGVTVMLCNWRPIIDMFPPQETVGRSTAHMTRVRIAADNLRIRHLQKRTVRVRSSAMSENSPCLICYSSNGKKEMLAPVTYKASSWPLVCRARVARRVSRQKIRLSHWVWPCRAESGRAAASA